jgi:flagellar hook-associated protein 2
MSSFSVGGLSTGIDYNDLISKLIEVQRQPIHILEDKKSAYNEKITLYGTLSTKLSALKSAIDNLKTSANFYAKSVSVSDSDVLEATVSGSASTGNYSVTVTTLASEENEVHSGTAASTTVINNSGGNRVFQYTYGGTQRTLTVANGKTLEGLKNLINNDTDNPGVTATIVNDGVGATPYRLILKGEDTGATKTITIDAGTTLDGTGSTTDFRSSTFTETKTASDSDFTIDDLRIKRSSNSITDVITGMTVNLKKDGIVSSTISVTPDRDTIKEQINSFVSAYNEVADFISANTAYDTSTGKSGTLAGEGTVRNIESRLRSIISSEVSDQPDEMGILAQLGITTDSKTGRLNVNSSTLDSKLASDLDNIAALFTNSTDGIATQLYSYINAVTSSSVKGFITARESGIKSVIENIDETIKNMEYRLDKTEQDLVRRFTSLESVVSGYSNIGNFLSNVNFSVRA